MKHGDGVKDVAFEVEDCAKLYHVSLLCMQYVAIAEGIGGLGKVVFAIQ